MNKIKSVQEKPDSTIELARWCYASIWDNGDFWGSGRETRRPKLSQMHGKKI